MMGPKVEVVYDGEKFTLPGGYARAEGRLAGTPGDNLVEFAGRVCYDAFPPLRPGRPSAEYHANVRALRHHSLHAHLVDTFDVEARPNRPGADPVFKALLALQNRPGVWVTFADPDHLRFAVSLRAVIEWDEHGLATDGAALAWADGVFEAKAAVYAALHASAVARYPLAAAGLRRPVPAEDLSPGFRVRRDRPIHARERWTSVYVDGVSRDLLQELVRHHWQANPSVRSTRYCDEGFSRQMLHPAYTACGDGDMAAVADGAFRAAKESYKRAFAGLRARDVDEKTARGAARSLLPGATETKMVFSASAFQWNHILDLRAAEATGKVDPEIKNLAAILRERLAGRL